MIREHLFADNPYRLIGTGSSVGQVVLRRRADAVRRSAQVGLIERPPLSDIFGDDVEPLNTVVRSLESNPVRRTVFRLTWPLHDSMLPFLEARGRLKRTENKSGEVAQVLFLSAWIEFLQVPSPADLTAALDQWHIMSHDAEFGDELTALLIKEDGLGRDVAFSKVCQAQQEVQAQILERSVHIAATRFQEGESQLTEGIVNAILNSSIDKHVQEMSLTPIVDLGDRLADSLSATAQSFTSSETQMPPEAWQLTRLASMVEDRHPCATTWRSAVEDCGSSLANVWIDRAIELSNRDDKFASALELLERAKTLTVRPEVADRIARNLKTVRGNLANSQQAASRPSPSASQYSPTSSSVPWGCIFWITILGIGGISSLFSHKDDPPASPGDSNGSTYTAPTYTPPGDTLPTTTGAQGSAPSTPAEDPHIANLQRRYDQLKSEIEQERPKIDSEQFALSAEKVSLDMQRERIESSSVLLDRTDPQAISAHNSAVDEFNASRSNYNRRVRRAESKLKSFNKKVEDLNAMAAELNANGR